MKNISIALSILFLSVASAGCNPLENNKKKKDPFYTQNGTFDRLSIPLIKPYKLIKISNNEWRLELQTTSLLTLSIHNVQAIDKRKNKILIYSQGGTEVTNKEYDTAWFIIDPVAAQEMFYSSEKSFRDALLKVGIDTIELRKPDEYYKYQYNKHAHTITLQIFDIHF